MMAHGLRWRVVGVSSPSGSYTQLGAVANALGVAYRGGRDLDLLVDGRSVTIGIMDDGEDGVFGFQVRLVLDDRAAKAPQIELRRELGEDRTAKASGLTREVQTGHLPFDGLVFVESDASNADVARLLAAAATRDAVLGLLGIVEGGVRVRTSPRAVLVEIPMYEAVFPVAPVLYAMEQLFVVAQAGAPREPAPRLPLRVRFVDLTILVAALLMLPALFLLVWEWAKWRIGIALPTLGAAAGVLVCLVSRPILRVASSGDSKSLHRFRDAQISLWITLPLLFPGSLVALNRALDSAPPVTVTGKVVGFDITGSDFDVGHSWAEVRWSDGATSYAENAPHTRLGDLYVQRRHPGALGFAWSEEPHAAP